MGCSSFGLPKQFHEMKESEKKEIIKILENEDENDKNLKYEEPKSPSTNFCTEIMNKIPYKKEESKERYELFQKLNNNRNRTYISCNRLNINLTNYLELPIIIREKDPISLASTSAIEKYSRKNNKILGWREFRTFLYYLKQYFTYWEKLIKDNNVEDCKINPEKFKESLPVIKSFVNDIDEKEFNKIDMYGKGEISFDEFCSVIIQKSIDDFKDDSADNKELKKFNI